jgi:hypothetical protein
MKKETKSLETLKLLKAEWDQESVSDTLRAGKRNDLYYRWLVQRIEAMESDLPSTRS